MGNICKICGNETVFSVWSTSRYFDRTFCKEVLGIPAFVYIYMNGEERKVPNGVPVCFKCVKQYKLMEAINERKKVQ